MVSTFQGSLLDLPPEGDHAAATCVGDVRISSLTESVTRTQLSDGAWIDVVPGWLSGALALFDRLQERVAWRAEERPMYDRVVAVPRLLHYVGEGRPLPDPALVAARDELNRHYQAELGSRFVTAGLCLYRDGRDSVAWHGDRIGRGAHSDTMVAILSLGAARTLMLRPRPDPARGAASDRGRVLRRTLGHGDLLVMGGSCQRTWEHAVPKTNRSVGPRISVQFRPPGVQ